jgi:tetratricopeptide (TPR) repeat protein
MSTPQHPSGSGPDPDPRAKASRRILFWQALVLPIASILIFFLLLEGGLVLFGRQPASQTADPFVGFAANAPLFLSSTDADGKRRLTTAPNRKDYFNRQSFMLEKAPDTYRIFSLGGSTTYGRPYADSTSFSGWLRELLPAADKSENWEVINTGGISYASYRVAQLMEELVRYQPDLFIIYTGHNEFLEERTYRKIKDIPPLVRSTTSLLARTRTWSAMASGLKALGISPPTASGDRFNLGVEVDTILDRSAGLDLYRRDDALREDILKHFRISLERMVTLARSVGARIIFVTPAANLKDCSPFKSQHTAGVDNKALQRSKELLAMSLPFAWEKKWPLVLQFLDEAVALDPRFADLHYRRGQALLALGRFDEAKRELVTARDEDVCPLRALTPMALIVAEVAREQGVMLVDYIDLLEREMQGRGMPPLLGQEYFLDHVHPTIEGHKLLALALLKAMTDMGLARPGSDWGERSIAAVAAKIESAVDQEEQGRALANLARVLLWAGKSDDAGRLARQAMDTAGTFQEVAVNAATTLATIYTSQGKPKPAIKLLYSALEKAPSAVELRLKLGQILLDRQSRNLEEAAANLLLVTRLMPYYDWGHALFGIDMAERGRPRIAYSSLMEALRLNPNNSEAAKRLAQVRPLLAGQEQNPQPPLLQLDVYPSGAPRTLTQGRQSVGGQFTPDGIEAVFHENGRLKRFTDYEQGLRHGVEMSWDENGSLSSRLMYRRGAADNDGKDK